MFVVRGVLWPVLYDSDCGFCKWLLVNLLRRDRDRRLRPVALQTPEAAELLADLTLEERMTSWHLISPYGERRSGGAAAPKLFEMLAGGRFLSAVFARFPRITDRGYRWVAGHRTQLSKFVPAGAKRRATEKLAGLELDRDARPTLP
jgi:predicted DCC family thiol-disulfide oxidoreductase YuxK